MFVHSVVITEKARFGLSRLKRTFVQLCDNCVPAAISSDAVLAEISLRSPRKLFNFINKKIIDGIKVPQKDN